MIPYSSKITITQIKKQPIQIVQLSPRLAVIKGLTIIYTQG